jgi:hypothetical protein
MEECPMTGPNTNDQELIYFNGLRQDGEYFTPPLTPAELTLSLTKPDKALIDETAGAESFALSPRVKDAMDLSTTGWGIIFPGEADDKHVAAVMEALDELLRLRETQAAPGGENYYRVFKGGFGYRPGDTRRTFLKRLGLGAADLVDPKKGVPYYLLLVGDPEEIPYRFQFELDVQFAVGRIGFGQDYAAYAHYAENVRMVETGEFKRELKATFFGVAHDEATRLSDRHLIDPLFDSMSNSFSGPNAEVSWTINRIPGAKAKRAQLEALMGGDETPALLFTASHGMAFLPDDPNQICHQGALVCQDWRRGPIQEKHYFAGDHISSQANLLGQIAFCFACFGAGTPSDNEFLRMDWLKHEKDPQLYPEPQPTIAPRPFIAGLPTQMLGRPNGALAFVGHVERAWTYSFGDRREHIETLDGTLYGLFMGDRLGFATDPMNLKYATLATEVTSEIQEIEKMQEKHPEDLEAYIRSKEKDLVGLWTEHNDARNYVIIGDPAVRLLVNDTEMAMAENLTLSPTEIRVSSIEETSEPGMGENAQPEEEPGQLHNEEPKPLLPPLGVQRVEVDEEPDQPEDEKAGRRQVRIGALADEEVYGYWQEHVKNSLEGNNEMFRRILNAFLGPYHATVWMNGILFAVGILSFVAAAVLSLWTGNPLYALAFGGLSVAAFLSYFISRPLRSLEENLEFITWLGLIYNTYWIRLLYLNDETTVQQDLEDATKDASREIERLIDKHAALSGKRPGTSK